MNRILRFESNLFRFFCLFDGLMCLDDSNVSFLCVFFGGCLVFHCCLLYVFDCFLCFVSFNFFLFSFGMNSDILGFLMFCISFCFGNISLCFDSMGCFLLKISLHFDGVGFNGSSCGFMSTGVSFFLSVFCIGFGFGGNVSLFLGGFLYFFCCVWL